MPIAGIAVNAITKTETLVNLPDPPVSDIGLLRSIGASKVNNISKQALDMLVYSAGKKAEYDRNFEYINATASAERTAFLTAKATAFTGYRLYEPDGVTVRKQVISGDMQSFIDYAVEAKVLVATAGDGIINERGACIQRVNASANETAINTEVANYRNFCDTKLSTLSIQWGQVNA